MFLMNYLRMVWLVDCLLLNFKWQVFMHIQDENELKKKKNRKIMGRWQTSRFSGFVWIYFKLNNDLTNILMYIDLHGHMFSSNSIQSWPVYLNQTQICQSKHWSSYLPIPYLLAPTNVFDDMVRLLTCFIIWLDG